MGQKSEPWSMTMNRVVKLFFEKSLPSFELTEEVSHGPYWGVTYKKGDLELKIGGDLGFQIIVLIDKKPFQLWQYDKSVNSASEATETNVLFQLKILKRFLGELESPASSK